MDFQQGYKSAVLLTLATRYLENHSFLLTYLMFEGFCLLFFPVVMKTHNRKSFSQHLFLSVSSSAHIVEYSLLCPFLLLC